jgi:acyl carrier protein
MNVSQDITRAKVVEVVLQSLDDLIGQREDIEVSGRPDESTVLMGVDGILDSLGLVTLIVDVEQSFDAELGVPVVLTDDRAMSQANSPFGSVKSLVDYLMALTQQEGTGG